MNVELLPAVVAGLVGGVAMLALQLARVGDARARQFDLLAMWARFLALEAQPAAGVIVHLGVSAAIAVLYAIAFRLAGAVDTGWAWGVIGGVIHWIVAGSFLGTVASDRNAATTEPGPFAMRAGSTVAVGFLVAHLAFGVIVGLVYFGLHSGGGINAAL